MKKTIPLFLLCIFLFNTVGYYIAFKAAQYEVKNEVELEIRSGLKTDELTTLTINKTDIGNIEWIEKNEEMRYNNELYDVAKSTENATTITFYCINDTKESSLFTNLDEHINTHIANKPAKDQNQKNIVDPVLKLYFSNGQFSFVDSYTMCSTFFPVVVNYSTVYSETNSPPPEFG